MKTLLKRALWPTEVEQSRWRPLRGGEQMSEGVAVRVEYDPRDGRVYRFAGWMWCGRERHALLDAGDGQRYVASEGRLRVQG